MEAVCASFTVFSSLVEDLYGQRMEVEGWKAGLGEQDGKKSGGWRAEKQMTRATSHF